MKRCVYLCLAIAGTAAMLLAAGFWEKKQFSEWSDKEVRRMLDDSPWAHGVSVVLMGRATLSPSADGANGGFGGGGGRGGGGGGGGGGRGGRGGGGGGLGESELARPTLDVVVQWVSALPIKQALVRSSMSSEQEMDEQTRQFLDREESYYVVAVGRIPARMARVSEGTDQFRENCRLERGNQGEPLVPDRVEVRPEQNRVTLFFFFPRTNPIQLEDKNIEFVFKLANNQIKRKFRLQDMIFGGKLEL
jgi:hypothetical protein